MPKMLLAVRAAAVVAATFALTEASARHRIRGYAWGTWAGQPRTSAAGGSRLTAPMPAAIASSATDPNSRYRRAVVYTALGPVARRVWACG